MLLTVFIAILPFASAIIGHSKLAEAVAKGSLVVPTGCVSNGDCNEALTIVIRLALSGTDLVSANFEGATMKFHLLNNTELDLVDGNVPLACRWFAKSYTMKFTWVSMTNMYLQSRTDCWRHNTEYASVYYFVDTITCSLTKLMGTYPEINHDDWLCGYC
jgi:uncharacterized protein YjbI with pentapeptide repeats